MTDDRRKPLWLYPNLLSLDAPLLAVAWLYVFAKTWRVTYHPWEAYVSLFLVVWIIYVVDRLLDASIHNAGSEVKLQIRHAFHLQHARKFKIGLAAAAPIALLLVILTMPVQIYGYFMVGGLMIAGFFMLSLFSSSTQGEIPYAKNILAGITFSYGVAMVAHVYTGFGLLELLKSKELICFAVLCALNICAIDLWEHARLSNDREIKAADELALILPLTLLGAASLIYALLDHEFTTRPFFYTTLSGAAFLLILNRIRTRFSHDALRVLADVAILIPLIIFLAFQSE